jgi:hypothetical protein
MIWAGMVFLEDKTNKSEDEIRRLPYPKFKAMIAYHGDPEKFLKAGVTEKDYLKTIEAAKEQNRQMMIKAKERQDKREKK